ncbi:MAG: NYN domain-containing protein [Betaproteobacteria bacterium]
MSDRSEVTNMAVFCDFENIALGVRDAEYEKFDIRKVLERLLLKGSIVVKKAYCDWERYKTFKAAMHEAAFELIEIPHVRQSGKNSADIRMVVDALDLCYTKSHVETFVIISGDSDFSPLVSKLRENDKNVIGVGVKNSTSDLLIANCDEFIFYDDLVREQRRRAPAKRGAQKAVAKAATKSADKAEKTTEPAAASAAMDKPASRRRRGTKGGTRAAAGESSAETSATPSDAAAADVPIYEIFPEAAAPESAVPDGHGEAGEEDRRQHAIDLVVETLEGLLAERGADDTVWGSMVKQTLKRRQPGFNESYYGYRSFNALLEDAQSRGLLALTRDEKSGGFKVRLSERTE